VLDSVVGILPLEIGQITELIKIDFSDSDLSAGPVPDSIGMCTKLEVVRLRNCNLQGQFPVGVRYLKALGMSRIVYNEIDYLSLFANRFNGNIPSWICELEKLSYLSLHENQFNGLIPECIGSLTLLSHLNLGENELSGELPIGICDLVNLIELRIYNNFVVGKILFY
jgi:hypothetical protein